MVIISIAGQSNFYWIYLEIVRKCMGISTDYVILISRYNLKISFSIVTNSYLACEISKAQELEMEI
ncbi:hypothetical protein LV92_00432 [Arenibacter echinorum]|uniref:Uncharacterized protein n=1 Tax=Arenibacter echinorum TaxID=440515 RepID=A0A327RFE4_9FLAO|nr:hypothetical protein LV92_00432 [Arenibacter echinorum]